MSGGPADHKQCQQSFELPPRDGNSDKTLQQVSDEITDWVEHDLVCTIIDRKSNLMDPSTTKHIPPNVGDHVAREGDVASKGMRDVGAIASSP